MQLGLGSFGPCGLQDLNIADIMAIKEDSRLLKILFLRLLLVESDSLEALNLCGRQVMFIVEIVFCSK